MEEGKRRGWDSRDSRCPNGCPPTKSVAVIWLVDENLRDEFGLRFL
ncbi:hypothetical protein SLEP1_g5169 [Rubroshorea leprosula]|uniref:Uncharacterized protein n=1 Tax=Rubroshorea leprosula TaxID=152421 RepID=A0AAV5HVE7_9ROSI|nr:hypothetical protein SLEP1_g5169 [Rubroshorea leprosula]